MGLLSLLPGLLLTSWEPGRGRHPKAQCPENWVTACCDGPYGTLSLLWHKTMAHIIVIVEGLWPCPGFLQDLGLFLSALSQSLISVSPTPSSALTSLRPGLQDRWRTGKVCRHRAQGGRGWPCRWRSQAGSSAALQRQLEGLELWLSSQEHRLLFQRTRVQFPAPTLKFVTISNSSTRSYRHKHR